MGGSQARSTLSDNEIVSTALASGVQVFAGFKAIEKRLLFVHAEHFPNKCPKLFTVLPDGSFEGANDAGKDLRPTREKGIITYPFAQTIKKELVDKNFKIRDSGCVFPRDDSTSRLAQVWTVNYNDEFRNVFTIEEANPNTEWFNEEAVNTFIDALVKLFGEDARDHPEKLLKFCHKSTQNIDRTYVGTPSQLKTFFAKEGVKETLGITSVGSDGDPNKIVVATKDRRGKRGSQTFTLGGQDDEPQVIYKRNGFTSFTCVKSLPQFEKDCLLHGEIK